MNSTTNRRKEYNYREKYLGRNKGTFLKGSYICAICYKTIGEDDMEVDHIVPLSKLGPNHVINCVATCRECNRKKSDKLEANILVKEVLWKIIEEISIGTKWVISSGLKAVFKIIFYPLSLAETGRDRLIIYLIYLAILFILLCEWGVLNAFS